MPFFVLFIYLFFRLCYLHPWPCLIWPNSHHSFCYPDMCYTTSMAWTFCIFHMQLFKWSVHYQVNKQPLSELWELMVDGKKSVLSRILVISSLPHSREFKRLSTSLFLLYLQSSAVGVVKLRCYYHQGHSRGFTVSLPAITSTCFQTKECSVV